MKEMNVLTKLIHRKSIFLYSYTQFEHFFNSLNSRTFVISKHNVHFPMPKISKKIITSIPCADTYADVHHALIQNGGEGVRTS